MNYDKIYNFFYSVILQKDKIIIPDYNEYRRVYDYEKFTIDEDYIPYSYDDLLNIYFNILNNGWDDFTFYCPTEYETCIEDIRKISSDENALSNINGYVSPFNVFYQINTTISNYREVYIVVDKKYSEEDIIKVNNKLNEVINNLKINELSTNEEKVKTYHDYLIESVVYDENFIDVTASKKDSNKATGALINGSAVCSGYSEALALFLDRLDIPNIIVTSETHAWNLVYLDDYWLHIDSTWNDTTNTLHEYEFYLINTNEILKLDPDQHTFDTNFFIEAI